MSRATYIWNEKLQRLVEKGGPDDPRHAHHARSDMPAPMLIRDGMDALRSMVTGRMHDSKSALRAEYKAHGVVEMGGEAPKAPSSAPRPSVTKSEIGEALQKVKQGYRPSIPQEKTTVQATGSTWID